MRGTKYWVYNTFPWGWTSTLHLNRRTRLSAVFYLIKKIDVNSIYKVIDVYVHLFRRNVEVHALWLHFFFIFTFTVTVGVSAVAVTLCSGGIFFAAM